MRYKSKNYLLYDKINTLTPKIYDYEKWKYLWKKMA